MEARPVKRALIGAGLIVAFFFALTLSVAPQLHERLHSNAPHHECAVTLIAAGNYHHAPAAPVETTAPTAIQFSRIPSLKPIWVASLFHRACIFEHAPPAIA